MEDFNSQISSRARPVKCLMGVTILLVEDSRSSSEALRMMAQASGARVRRADSIHAANRHLGAFRPSIALIDLGLPDGNGLELIKLIAEHNDHDMPVIAMSGTDPEEAELQSRQAGAAAFLEKPINGLSVFQRTLLEHLPDRAIDAAQNPRFDAKLPKLEMSFIELDLENACDLLREGIQTGDRDELAYCAKFMIGVSKQMEDSDLMKLSMQLSARVNGGNPGEKIGAELLSRIETRLTSQKSAMG